MKCQRVSPLFLQWSDTRLSYGLNFASLEEAQSFSQAVDAALLKLGQCSFSFLLFNLFNFFSNAKKIFLYINKILKNAPVQPSAPIPVQHHRTGSSRTSGPPKSGGRGDVNADDIPPPPVVTAEDLSRKLAERSKAPAKGAPPAGSGGATQSPAIGARGMVTKAELEAAKAELAALIRREVEAAKREVLEAISRLSGKPIVFPPPPPPL